MVLLVQVSNRWHCMYLHRNKILVTNKWASQMTAAVKAQKCINYRIHTVHHLYGIETKQILNNIHFKLIKVSVKICKKCVNTSNAFHCGVYLKVILRK